MSERAEPNEAQQEDRPTAEGTRALDAEADSRPSETDDVDAARQSVPANRVAELEARARAAEEQMHEMQLRFAEMRDEMQRQADETRGRLNRAADERALGAKTEFVSALLPVMDNLQRSLEATRTTGSIEALLHGLERTVRGFESSLASIGVEPVPSVGEMFDPAMHQAVDTVEVQDDADGRVTREYSRGYRLGDRLLRPAHVQVGRASAVQPKGREHRFTRNSFM